MQTIKLIATDLDGTLLDDNKNIHESFWDAHEKLTRQGVLFVAASGRQYYTLEKQFERIKDNIIILAENGTMVMHRNKELLTNALPLETARELIVKAREVPDTDVILCGKSSAFVESSYENFWSDAAQYYSRLQKVDDLLKVEDTILKVTLWDHKIAEENAYPYFKSYEDRFKVAVAGEVWLDITNKTANKGYALQKIQELFGVSFEETLLFGDYLNDIDLMTAGWHSYAMKNAHPKIKDLSRFITRYDNNNNGVVETLWELFEDLQKN